MHTILLFGAGKSATVLIDYLIEESASSGWQVIIADSSREVILAKTNNAAGVTVAELDINDTPARQGWIHQADIVISLMPPALHYLVADDCIRFSKNLLTASYVDPALRAREQEIADKGVLFLCEMGLDPGIDHMSAMQLIDWIKHDVGGTITSFKSHCGGLVAPESDDNPWRYKISWNPRNVVLAGKAGAVYKINNEIVTEPYAELFNTERGTFINNTLGTLGYYPNRDSLPYIDLYGLHDAHTFLRTTLRYPDFMYGWRNIVELNLTDETTMYDTTNLTLGQFFQVHFARNNFEKLIREKIDDRLAVAQNLMDKLRKLEVAQTEIEERAARGEAIESPKEVSMVTASGSFQTININEMKLKATTAMSQKVHEANLTLQQLFFLGADGDTTLINKGQCSAADILQFALEQKLVLHPDDRDMIVMKHEIEYVWDNKPFKIESSLVVKGENSLRTAMAKTVGLPLGIAAKLILSGKIRKTGLHIPITPDIYNPVLEVLGERGIVFEEEESEL